MTFKYVSAEEILRLHYEIIEDFGGTHGVRDENRLKSAVKAPKQEAFGRVQYPSLYEKAAVYIRNIIADHPFIDGSKRTALTVSGIFLARNGHAISAIPRELEEFTVRITTKHLEVAVIARWLEIHTD